MNYLTQCCVFMAMSISSTYSFADPVAETNKELEFESALSHSIQFEGELIETFDVRTRMKKYQVPAVSVALIEGNEITWTKAWGVKDIVSKTPATSKMLFQAASISKSVAAFAAMRLVAQGELSLDEPVDRYLKRWKIPPNAYTRREPVTLRRLLSHSAGMSVPGYGGYAADQPLPTILSVLNGKEPANSKPVVVDTLPGSAWRYSGGGYTVVQLAMEDVTGLPFDRLMANLVLEPIGMTSSTYTQPLPLHQRGQAVTAYRSNLNPVNYKFHVYPEMAAAGLWTTPIDLAKFAMSVTQAWQEQSSELLSQSLTQEFLSVQKGTWGLGFELHQQQGDVVAFSHSGGNEGFRTYLVSLLDGRGIAIMTNSDTGQALIKEMLVAAATVYDWPIFQPQKKHALELDEKIGKMISGVYQVVLGNETLRIRVQFNGRSLTIENTDYLPISDYRLDEFDEERATFFSKSGNKFVFSGISEKNPVMHVFGRQAIKIIK